MLKHKHYATKTNSNERAKEMERFRQARDIRRAMRPLPTKVAAPYLEQEPAEDYVPHIRIHSTFFKSKMATLRKFGTK